jgi:uncharacterized membrane protein
MVDDKQIKQWLKEGTITEAQANKMLADSSSGKSEEKSNKFIAIIAIIGAVLIFIGFAWLIAKNWHQIADFVKVLILVSATVAAFVSGVISRQKNHEGVGRSLITLGALLYILSLFLISQIYDLTTTAQHYAWLLFFAWTVILIIAYLIDSPENVVVSMLVFFPWLIVQYISSFSKNSNLPEQGIIFSFILMFISAGVLLFGLSTFHHSIKHRFTNIYRFWTVFYFLLIFYLLSFQSFLPMISEFSFEAGAFTFFLVVFVLLCLLGFILGTLFATSKNPGSLKESMIFIGILAILLILISLTKIGSGLVGYCNEKSCYDFKDSTDCGSSQSPLICEWKTDRLNNPGYCQEVNCYNFKSETECTSLAAHKPLVCEWKTDQYNNLGSCQQVNCFDIKTQTECAALYIGSGSNCVWQNNQCQQNWNNQLYETCNKYTNQKNNCEANGLCSWHPSYGLSGASGGLPTSLWLLWILNNIIFIGFIILIMWYGLNIGSTKIVNLALFAFILEIVSRYIGFWMDFKGYFAFSILAILGGLMLIFGAWQIPKWRRKLLEKTKRPQETDRGFER